MTTERSASTRPPDASAVTGSPVRVDEVTDEHVVLELPDSVHDADRVIPDRFRADGPELVLLGFGTEATPCPVQRRLCGDGEVGPGFGFVAQPSRWTVRRRDGGAERNRERPRRFGVVLGTTDHGEAVEPRSLYPMVIVPTQTSSLTTGRSCSSIWTMSSTFGTTGRV